MIDQTDVCPQCGCPVGLRISPVLSFKINWEPTEDGTLRGVFQEKARREWVLAGPPPDVAQGDSPPDDMMQLIANTIEPFDLQVGAMLLASQLDPAVYQPMADRLLKGVLAIMAWERACVGAEAGKTPIPELDYDLHEILDKVKVEPRIWRRTADALLFGFTQILLAERAVRSRSLLETHAINFVRTLADQEGIEGLLGNQITVAVVFQSKGEPQEKQLPVTPDDAETINKLLEEHGAQREEGVVNAV